MDRDVPVPALLAVSIAIALVVALAAATGAVASEDGYDLTADGVVDTPERTVDVDGEEHTVDATVVREPGDELVVEATVPDEDAEYNVDLRNSDNQVVQSIPMEGSGEAELAIDREPGSYVIVLRHDGIRTILPLVIAGYDVELSMPTEVERGSTATATVEVEEGASSGDPHAVEVVVGDADELERFIAERTGDGQYEATIDGDALPAGEYLAYAVTKTDEEVDVGDEYEVVGVSGSHEVRFAAQDDSGADDGPGADDGSGADDGAADEDPTPTPTDDAQTTTPDGTPTPTESDAPGADDGAADATPTPESADDGVLTPREQTPSDDSETDTEAIGAAPGTGIVVATLVGLGIWIRRRTGR